MDSYIIAMMLGASLFLGGLALIAFLWAIKDGQFDDKEKFLNQALFDGEEELNEAVDIEKRKEALKKKKYMPE